MATKWRTIREKMDPERQEQIRKRTEELLAELPLQELRQARALSQQELAEVLDSWKRWAGSSRSARTSRKGKCAFNFSRNSMPRRTRSKPERSEVDQRGFWAAPHPITTELRLRRASRGSGEHRREHCGVQNRMGRDQGTSIRRP